MSNYREHIVEYGQNIWDVAVQNYGSDQALVLLLQDNDLSFDSCLEVGQRLLIRKEITPNPFDSERGGYYEDTVVQNQYRLKKIEVNTGDQWETGGAFSFGFSFGFH